MSAASGPMFVPAVRRARSATFSPAQRSMLAGARGLAHLFDDRFRIFGIRFGLDNIVGFIPFVGDAIAAVASLYLVLVGIQLRLPPTKLARMIAIAGADFLIGLIPFVGDAADLVFKSHVRNLRIIEEHVRRVEGGGR